MKWYNQPITIKRALFAVMIANANTLMVYKMWQSDVKKAVEMREDLSLRIKILDDIANDLMEHASDDTLIDLNKRLDYWRVVLGQPTVAQD